MTTSSFQAAASPSDIRNCGTTAGDFTARRGRSAAFFLGNVEPTLDEVIGDPMVRRLMDRDGVEVDVLRTLMEEIRDRLA
jgi:hypothetical protein